MIKDSVFVIKNRIQNITRRFRFKSKEGRFEFFEVGFHGDTYLLKLVEHLLYGCKYFIETGTNVGSTLAYVAKSYPNIICLSCEPSKEAFKQALKNTSKYTNVYTFNETSQKFIVRIKKDYTNLFDENILFWLDAHGYGFNWPLREELNFITTEFKKAYILIDDFLVPGLDCFVYDVYREQVCSFDYVKDSINPNIKYNLYYPNYTKKTSKHRSLMGWGLLEFSHDDELKVPKFLSDNVRRAS